MPVHGERGVDRPCPLAEQLDRGAVGGERGDAIDMFIGHAQRLATGRQDLQVPAATDQLLNEDGDLADEVFAVVDHQQDTAIADPVHDSVEQRLLAERDKRQRRRDRVDDCACVGHRSEIDKEHAPVELGHVAVAELDRRPRLADTTGARERDDVR